MKLKQLKPRKLAVFDLDNTLIDSGAKLRADFVGAMYHLGIKITPEETNQPWYEIAQKYGYSRKQFDTAFDKRKTWEQSLVDGEVPIFPETRECLEELKNNDITLALLSKSIPAYTKTKLDYFDLQKYFEVVETIHPKEPSKIEGAKKILQILNPDSILRSYFIGDKEEDVIVAKALENSRERYYFCRGIYVNRNESKLQGYPNARNIKEVNKIILRE